MTENGAKTEHNGSEHVAHVQRAEGGQVCVAAGPGWSLFWPRAEWEALRPAARRKAIRNARRRYAAELVEDDRDPYAELVDQVDPYREWE